MWRFLPREIESLWTLFTAPLVWAGHFLACYVAAAVFCEKPHLFGSDFGWRWWPSCSRPSCRGDSGASVRASRPMTSPQGATVCCSKAMLRCSCRDSVS